MIGAVALKARALERRIDLAGKIDSACTERQHEDSDEDRAKHVPVT
jgi:hypothetical protein